MASRWPGPPRHYEDSVDSFLLRLAIVSRDIRARAADIPIWHSNPTGAHTVVAASAPAGALRSVRVHLDWAVRPQNLQTIGLV